MPAGGFGEMLRRLRHAARLTQEELAEAAGISTRSVSDLERGINATARKDTTRRLADALGLAGDLREQFEAAAFGRQPAPAARTLPRRPVWFTGREDELRQLVAAAGGTRGVLEIHAIGGMAGVGKTALAVHAAYELAESFPDGQLFLPLHGHTPGQEPVPARDALGTLLLAAGEPASGIPAETTARAALWRARTAGKKFLVILDDAVSTEQARPLLPGGPGSLVIVTSRRRLIDLEDSRAISLDALPLAEAALLFRRLADRPGQDAEPAVTDEVARLCGRLPLALGLQARRLHHHPTWSVADLAAELRAERDRLALAETANLPVGTAFRMSYAELPASQQRLFGELGLHPGTEIDVYAAAALHGGDLDAARTSLDGLYDHYFLIEFQRRRYRMHDLIREYARALAADSAPAGQDACVTRLFDYYLHTAAAANVHLARRASAVMQEIDVKAPAHAPQLRSQDEAVAWMNAERQNLGSVVEHAARHYRPGYPVALAAAMQSFLRTQGYWDQGLALHEIALRVAGEQNDRRAEAGALTDLADMQYVTGSYAAAARSLQRALALSRESGDLLSEAEAVKLLSFVQYETGDRAAAIASLSRALDCFRMLRNRVEEATALGYIAVVRHANGQYMRAAANQEQALALHRELGDRYGEANALNFLGAVQEALGQYQLAAGNQELALALHVAHGNRFGQANALHWLGAAQQGSGDYPAAGASQQRALRLYRDLGYRMGEANVLHRMGSLAVATADRAAGAGLLAQALALFGELGIAQGEAEVLNTMGELALADARQADAESCYQRAQAIADRIELPPEQARAVEGLARCSLRRGDREAAADGFRRALVICRDLGPVHVARIEEALRGL